MVIINPHKKGFANMQLNQQKPEKRVFEEDVLDFHSMFLTIQGEGPFTGRKAVFIRLAGCNLQCPNCDTEYTEGRHYLSPVVLTQQAANLWRGQDHGLLYNGNRSRPLVVITGGEPLRQEIGPLVRLLLNFGFEVQIESNGVFAPTQRLYELLMFNSHCHLIVSPKTSRVHDDCHRLARAFKYVLSYDQVEPSDGLPLRALMHKASPHIARPNEKFKGDIYVNPEDSKDPIINRLNLQAVVNSCMKHGYIAGIQLHKLLDLA